MRLRIHEYGDSAGRPVVCLHGVHGHGQRFRRLGLGPLADWRVLAPDLRGHGRSDWSPPWSTATHAADVLETADGLRVRRAAWVGFSFGARVVAAVAAMAPERVERVVLLDPALQLPADFCQQEAEAELEPKTFASAEEAIEDRLAVGTLFHTPREMLEEEMGQHLEPVAGGLRYRYSPVAAIAAWGEMADEPAPVADVPTLFVRGERSWLPHDTQVDRYRDRLGRRLQRVSVPGGHTVLWDAFDETGAAVAAFLETGG